MGNILSRQGIVLKCEKVEAEINSQQTLLWNLIEDCKFAKIKKL